MRPTLEELADARGEAMEFLAKNPDSELRSWLSVLIRATAPLAPASGWCARGSGTGAEGRIVSLDSEGFTQLYKLDDRRGVWSREVNDAESMKPTRLDLRAGREGDDHQLTLKAGDAITPETLWILNEILSYAKDAKASFYPDFVVCNECGKEFPLDSGLDPDCAR